MRAGPVSVCLLVLASGTLLFSAGAGAIPGSPGPLSVSGEPSPELSLANPRRDPNENGAAGQAGGPAESSVLTSELETSLLAAEPRETAPLLSIPCMHGFLDGKVIANNTGEESCSTPAGGQQRFSVQFGSRIGAHSRMLGEFDGIRVDYRLASGLTLQGIAGYPVLSSKDRFNATKQMYGISAITGEFARAWDLNSYLVEQQNNGKVSSRSVGGAVRYLNSRRPMLVFVDYDILEDSLSSFMISGAWKLPDRTTLSATLDIRNNPIEKHQKEYLQQTMASNEGWKWILPDKRITHFTNNGSNEVATLALGLSHGFSQRIKLAGDVAMIAVSSSAEAGDSIASAAQLREQFFHLKLSFADMMIAGDKSMLDLRHRVTSSSRISSASIDTEYDISRLWNISPRLRADYRNNAPESSVQWMVSPAVQIKYRGRKQYGLDIQAGGEWSAREDADGYEARASYFVSMGYKADF